MNLKFLQEKEKQEVITYLVGFIVILSALVYFVGVDLHFEEPDVILEGRENFSEIKTTLVNIESAHDFARFRSFNLIEPFGGRPGRQNFFQAGRMETIQAVERGAVEVTQPVEVLFEDPEEEIITE